MEIFTIGIEQDAEDLFFKLGAENIPIVIDVRLDNSQPPNRMRNMKEFIKILKKDLNCKYVHEINFAPTQELLAIYDDPKVTWAKYQKMFHELLSSRNIDEIFREKYMGYDKICLLCREKLPTECHRRLVAELLQMSDSTITITHL